MPVTFFYEGNSHSIYNAWYPRAAVKFTSTKKSYKLEDKNKTTGERTALEVNVPVKQK